MELFKLDDGKTKGLRIRLENIEKDITVVIDIPKRNLRLHTDTDFLVWNKKGIKIWISDIHNKKDEIRKFLEDKESLFKEI